MRSDPPTDPSAQGALRERAFVGVLATAFVVALGFGLIVPALPAFARSLGASVASTSLVISTFALVRLAASAPAGALVDRVGAANVVTTGLLVVSASSVATAFAGSFTQLVALRAVGGIGSAMFITGIGQHLVVAIPSNARGRANGLLQAAFLLGGASGPAVGGLLIEATGARTLFFVYAALLAVGAVVATAFIGRTASREHAVVAGDPEVVTDLVAAAPSTGGSLAGLWRDSTFIAALVISVATNWVSQGTSFVGVPLFGEALGLKPGTVGLALTAGAVVHGAVLWPVARALDRRGRRSPAIAGLAVYVAATAGLSTATNGGALIVWMGLAGLATGLVSSVPAAVVGDLAPTNAAGRAVGALGVARDTGAVLGPLALGQLAGSVGFRGAFLSGTVLLAIALVAATRMRETLGRGGDAQPRP